MATTRIFIDSRVNDQNLLISQFAPGTSYQLLDARLDGIEQIATALAGEGGYDSIEIISHGAPGSITLGSSVLDVGTLAAYAGLLKTIGHALTENGDLLLYGCNVAAGDVGQQFVNTLAALTGADVAASDDVTGSAALGGDWELEVRSGTIDGSNIQTFNLDGTLETANTINGSIFEDYIDADAWDIANKAPSKNDSIYGDRSNDTIDGGLGDDTAKYDQSYTNYTITRNGDWTITVKDNRTGSPLGTDTLIDVEHLNFAWYQSGYGNQSQTLNLTIQGTPSTQANTINGSIFEDTIDADAWDAANNAPSTNDFIYGDASNDTIDGGAGDDTAKYDQSYTNYTITRNSDWTITVKDNRSGSSLGTDTLIDVEHLNFAWYQSGYGNQSQTLNLTIQGTPSTQANTINGSIFEDTIDADAWDAANNAPSTNDFIYGDASNDTIDGGAGDDTAKYDQSYTNYTITRNSDWTITVKDNRSGSSLGTDTLIDVEHLNFAWYQSGYGNQSQTLNLTIQGTPSTQANTINGSIFEDTIDADAWDAANNAPSTNDFIYGDASNDTIDGGAGDDTAKYDQSYTNYTITRNSDWTITVKDNRSGSSLGTDTLIDVEHLNFAWYQSGYGNQSQTLNLTIQGTPSTQANTINGSIFEDTIDADAWDAANNAPSTNDFIYGDASNDKIDGGAGDDTAKYDQSYTNYTITRNSDWTITVEDNRSGSPLGTDTLIDVEHLNFAWYQSGYGNQSQTLNLTIQGTPSTQANTINGSIFEDYIDTDAWGIANNALSTNDSIYGDASNDTIDGGAGDDTAKYDQSYTNYTITRNSDWTITVEDNRSGSPLGTDTLIDVEHLNFAWYQSGYGNQSQTLNLTIQGTPSTQANTINGSIFEDYIDADAWGIANNALSTNDSIYGDSSNDTIDGGSGDDTAKYADPYTNYTITRNNDGTITVTDNRTGSPLGTDTLIDVEHLNFAWYQSGYGNQSQTLNLSYIDVVAPTLISSTPSDNSVGIQVNSNIILTFSEKVQAGTGNIIITDGNDTRTIDVTDSSQVTFSGKTVTINPTDDLQVNSHYHLDIASGVIKDKSGNAFAGITDTTTLDFSTNNQNHAPHIAIPDSIIAVEKADYAMGLIIIFDISYDMINDHLRVSIIDEISPVVSLLFIDGTFVLQEKKSSYDVIIDDFNDDGNNDFMVFGDYSATFLGNGDGTVTKDNDCNEIGNTNTSDFNQDGIFDYVVKNIISNSVSVFLGLEDGTFNPMSEYLIQGVDYSKESDESAIIICDLNDDGNNDILVAVLWNTTVSILLNNGDGTFASELVYDGSLPFNGEATNEIDIQFSYDEDCTNMHLPYLTVFTDDNTITTFIEQTPVGVCNNIAIDDLDGDADWNGGSLSIQISGNAEATDSLSLPDIILSPIEVGFTKAIWLNTWNHNAIMSDDTVIGMADGNSAVGDAIWHFTFNENATNLLVQDVARAIHFNNSSNTPSELARHITFTVTDNFGASASIEQVIGVTAVPTLISSTPSDNAAAVAIDSNIALTFDEHIQAGTGNIIITDGTDVRTIAVTDPTQVTFDGNTITINPTDDLHFGSHYHIEIATVVIKDIAGNSYAGTRNAAPLDFVTIDNSTTIFCDDFSNPLSSTLWDYNHWQAVNNPSYYGRTQQRQSLPEVSDGYLHLKLDTYNPTGYSFFGSEAITNQTFSNDNGAIVFEVKAHFVNPIADGIVGGMFFYSPNSGSTHDEIDYEAVSNRLNEIQTNIYANEPLGTGHPQFNTITGTLTDDHVYRAEWYKDTVLWFVDGNLIREEATHIPTQPMALHFNIWAPGQEWAEGYNSGLNPVSNVADNTSYYFDIDSVCVTQLSSTYYYDDAPVLASSTPSDDATAVAIDSNITLTFSENVLAGTGNIVISNDTDIRSIDVTDSSQVIFDGDTIIINPTDDLHAGSNYHVEIDNGVIQDTAGNAFAGISEAETLNFETEPNALSGYITFWKTGEAITDITTTLTALPTNGTQHAIELKNIHVKADGSHTVEVWATTPNSTTGSFECEFVLPTGANATWQDAAKLPAGWTSTSNTIASGNFLVDGMSTNPMAEGQAKLGTLTITQATNSDTFELAMAHAQLGDDDVAGYAISSVSSTTGSGNEYSYHALTDGHYALTGDKAAGVAGRAVHANDALAALKMVVELNPNGDGSAVLPYQYLAADINHDGKVRANDALNILKMAVGIESAPAEEWIFVSKAVAGKTMDRSHVDWSDIAPTIDFNHNSIELDLIGIVKGDVDGSWAA